MNPLENPEQFVFPPPLAPGDTLCVIAPSSPFDRTLVLRGMGFLAQRYRLKFDPGMFSRTGFLAGSDQRRLAELNGALADSRVKAVIAARGGYGLTRIAHAACWSELVSSPKWLIGFSDFTALHIEAARLGIASLHGHGVAGFGRAHEKLRQSLIDALEYPQQERRYAASEIWRSGRATGPLWGGNLALLYACAAAGRLRVPRGALWVLEDVGESSYRVDRMLSALWVAGILDRLAGIAVGSFTECDAGKYGVPVEAVLHERLTQLGIPVFAGLPFGHGAYNEPLILGARAMLAPESRELVTGWPTPH